MLQENQALVEFYTDSVHSRVQSEKAGRPVHVDLPHLHIMVPGDKDNIVRRIASRADQQKYPKAWEAYLKQEDVAVSGTPLTEWPPIAKSQVKDAAHFGIKTVEQLAGLSDSHVTRMGIGWQDLRTKAKAYLTAADDGSETVRLASENERLTNRVKELEAQVQELSQRRGPGRPPKEPTE